MLQSALLPFGAALAVLLAMRKVAGSDGASALAVAAGALATYFAIHSWSPMPQQALDWLPWITLLAVAGAMAVRRAGHAAARGAVRLVIGGGAAALTLAPVMASFEPARLLVLLAVTAVALSAVWTMFAADTGGARVSPLILTIVAGGAGLALMIDASQSLGQLNGALAMACAASFFAGLVIQDRFFGQAAIGTALSLLAALLLNAHVYAEFSPAYVGLLVAGLAGGALTGLWRGSGATAVFIRVLLTGLPVLVMLALVLKTAAESGGY